MIQRLSLVLAIAATHPLIAQTTWVVPNYADLAPYIAQATPGDTLLLSSQHPVFRLDKGLILRPAGPRTTIVPASLPWPAIDGVTEIDVPSNEVAALLHIDFPSAGASLIGNGGQYVVVNGVVSLEDCTIAANSIVQESCLRVLGGAVTLRNCQLQGVIYATALRVDAGLCSLVDCSLVGSNGFNTSTPIWPQPAAVVNGGTLVATFTSFVPGVATVSSFGNPIGPVSGVLVNGGLALLSDGTAFGGDFPMWTGYPGPTMGAPAVVAGGQVRQNRFSMIPGNGSPAAPPSTGGVVSDAGLLGSSSSGSLQIGSTWTMTVVVDSAGGLVGSVFWFALAPSLIPEVVEPTWGSLAQAIPVFLGAPPAGGMLTVQLAIPAAPSLAGASLWAQGFQLDPSGGSPVHVSAVVGGIVH